MRYERVPELARTILKEGATQATILQVIANLKSSLFHPYHHTEMVYHMYEWTLLDRFQNLYSKDKIKRMECVNHAYIESDSHQKLQTDMGAHHLWIPYMPTDGHNPGPHERKGSEPPPTVPAAKKPYAKKVGKDSKGKMLASSASSSSSPQSTTPLPLIPRVTKEKIRKKWT